MVLIYGTEETSAEVRARFATEQYYDIRDDDAPGVTRARIESALRCGALPILHHDTGEWTVYR